MTDAFEAEFFSGGRVERIDLEILSDLWQALQSEFAANAWSLDEGLRYTLAAGLAALRAAPVQPAPARAEEAALEIRRLQSERLQLEGQYAVMKFRTYQFMEAAKAFQRKFNAAQAELDGLRRANQLLRERLDGQG
jgi:hypothetical protein